MKIISTYAGHESNISFYVDGKITVVELDKLANSKYFALEDLSIVEKCLDDSYAQIFLEELK